jgi:hypothetical protein
MGLEDFDRLVADFLAAEKACHVRPRWRYGRHPDFAEAKMVVGVPGSRVMVGLVALQAHRVRMPPKYSYSLLFRGKRILALDVNPGRHHRNLLLPGGSVNVTHWQRWPAMDAEPDSREMNFNQWLTEFQRQASIVTTFRVLSPPRGVQLRLIVNEDFDRRKPKGDGR